MAGHDDTDEQQDWPEAARLIEVTLDEASIGRNNAEVEHEREVAIFDLIEQQPLRAGKPRRRRPLYAAALARRQPPGLHRRRRRRASRSST